MVHKPHHAPNVRVIESRVHRIQVHGRIVVLGRAAQQENLPYGGWATPAVRVLRRHGVQIDGTQQVGIEQFQEHAALRAAPLIEIVVSAVGHFTALGRVGVVVAVQVLGAGVVAGEGLGDQQLRFLHAPHQVSMTSGIVAGTDLVIHVPGGTGPTVGKVRMDVELEASHDLIVVGEIDDIDRPLGQPLRYGPLVFRDIGRRHVVDQHRQHVKLPRILIVGQAHLRGVPFLAEDHFLGEQAFVEQVVDQVPRRIIADRITMPMVFQLDLPEDQLGERKLGADFPLAEHQRPHGRGGRTRGNGDRVAFSGDLPTLLGVVPGIGQQIAQPPRQRAGIDIGRAEEHFCLTHGEGSIDPFAAIG